MYQKDVYGHQFGIKRGKAKAGDSRAQVEIPAFEAEKHVKPRNVDIGSGESSPRAIELLSNAFVFIMIRFGPVPLFWLYRGII